MKCYPWQRGCAITAGARVREALVMGLGLLALGLVPGSLGNLSRALNGILAVGALLGVALILPRRQGRIGGMRLVGALAIAAASLPIVARGEPLGLPGAALFFFALSLWSSPRAGASARTDEGPAGVVSALLLTSLLFALYRTLVAFLPGLWYLEQGTSIQFSWFTGVGLMLGPTALGFPLLVLFGLYALSVTLLVLSRDPATADEGGHREPPLPVRLREEEGGHGGPPLQQLLHQPGGSRRRGWRAALLFGAWLVMLGLAVVAFLWLQPPLGSWLVAHWPAPAMPYTTASPLPALSYLESLPLLFVLLWLGSVPASLALRPSRLPLVPSPKTGRWAAVGLGLLALATVVLTLDPPFRPQRGTVLFYDTGHLQWGRPVFGQYGPQSGGTFGLWPDYLAAYGYQARTGPLTAENLREVQAVVLINQPADLSAVEQERLLAFVEAGGGLVVWAEHTDVGGLREPINELLSRLPGRRGAPIQVRFDSAVPSRQGWAEGLALRPHPALYAVQDPVDLVIAVGASLDIKPPAEPLIIGRFGHSDQGDVTNRVQNYVGDMRYGRGERLGDVVLAAEVGYGRGRIVVLGDTTPLGSVNLMTSMPFHARLLDWVTAEQPRGWGLVLRNGWLAALLLVGAGACLVPARSRLMLAGAALVLGVVLTVTGQLNTVRSAPPVPRGPIAYVDASHLERFDRLLWEDTSIGGLGYNLVRNGMLPLLLREVDSSALSQAELLVLIAPGKSFSPQEVATIRGWVEGGGRLLVTVGYEESEASQLLLASLGLGVDPIPLGPAEVERQAGLVRLHEAWPVSASDGQPQTIVAAYGYPLAEYQPRGKGGVVLIGDSAFLLGGTLEGQTTVQEGNILLLRDILQEYLGLGGRP